MNLSEQDLQEENKHLELTINLLRKNISELAQDLYDNEQKQQEFKKYVWDTRSELDPTEMKTIMVTVQIIMLFEDLCFFSGNRLERPVSF